MKTIFCHGNKKCRICHGYVVIFAMSIKIELPLQYENSKNFKNLPWEHYKKKLNLPCSEDKNVMDLLSNHNAQTKTKKHGHMTTKNTCIKISQQIWIAMATTMSLPMVKHENYGLQITMANYGLNMGGRTPKLSLPYPITKDEICHGNNVETRQKFVTCEN